MKIRNGFVSNSSSSSFILKKNEVYKNPIDLASEMVRCRYNYDDNDELSYHFKLMQRKNKLQILEDIQKSVDVKSIPSNNIYFRSCNYDTFIAEVEDYILVETCNNEDWDPAISKGIEISSSQLPEHIVEKYNIDYECIDLKGIIFYSPYINKWGKTIENYISCNCCFEKVWEDLDDKHLFCPSCGSKLAKVGQYTKTYSGREYTYDSMVSYKKEDNKWVIYEDHKKIHEIESDTEPTIEELKQIFEKYGKTRT